MSRLAASPIRLLAPLHAAVALALPPRCPACGVPVAADHRFCAVCWTTLRFIAPPWCATCCVPFAFNPGEGAICGECRDRPPAHAGVRAAVGYGPVARDLALGLKYARRTGHAETMARLMLRLMPAEAQLLVPVPLHRWRIWGRGYNQAALIADALHRLSGVAADRDVLLRTRRTVVLRGLGGQRRRRAVARAFAVAEVERVRGRAVVLVDDVFTSGATAEGCTAALLGAGAASVAILCWARVLADAD